MSVMTTSPTFGCSRRQLLGAAGWLGLGAAALPAAATVPAGGAQAHVTGVFGPVFAWPVMPIHTALLPDGRVLGFGTDTTGAQGATLRYVVWDPALGESPEAMLLLDNRTGTDIFCAGQVLTASGQLLLLGGDRIVGSQRNYANDKVNLFDPATLTLTEQPQSMRFQRWYASALETLQGDTLVLGGRIDKTYAGDPDTPATTETVASTPELRGLDGHWRTLDGARNEYAYGSKNVSFYYPRGWLAPDGRVLIVGHGTELYALNTEGTGRLSTLPVPLPLGHQLLPSALFAPGRVLSARRSAQAVVIDFNSPTPQVSATAALALNRQYGNLTVLADGQVWANGGTANGNSLDGASWEGEIWNPATGRWQATATAKKARLYHSTALLLPDGSVLTGGGGSPGPQTNLNAERFYPPYLYLKDGSGLPAPRPVIKKAPTVVVRGQKFKLTLKDSPAISRVTLLRLGAVTHNFNSGQSFDALAFTQVAQQLRLKISAARWQTPPGFYLLFVWDGAGVPSQAAIVRLVEA